MLKLGKRKQNWACASALTQHHEPCQKIQITRFTLGSCQEEQFSFFDWLPLAVPSSPQKKSQQEDSEEEEGGGAPPQ